MVVVVVIVSVSIGVGVVVGIGGVVRAAVSSVVAAVSGVVVVGVIGVSAIAVVGVISDIFNTRFLDFVLVFIIVVSTAGYLWFVLWSLVIIMLLWLRWRL